MTNEQLENWLEEEHDKVKDEGLEYYHVSLEGLVALLAKQAVRLDA